MKIEKGFIQVYTGNGKGKSTAAIGQAIRAAGHGLRTLIVQFMKEYPYGEVETLNKLSEFITIEQYCGDDFVLKKTLPPQSELDKVKKAFKRIESAFQHGEYDLVILDEICVSIYFKLVETSAVIELIQKKPEHIELIMTGRYCPQEIIEIADLVTEMKEVKHYYSEGVLARKGIEY
ncbi:MAG TPA: cob(I)yrinic acid a,c-diamide adenosyltransferase [Ignavibacteriaceae bacterium]|mgnify:CR=1 FL=1|nr:cob(I)yrinic acid a,c-diamide adenosyltransferase [Ignavibacteriaceae bacterium]